MKKFVSMFIILGMMSFSGAGVAATAKTTKKAKATQSKKYKVKKASTKKAKTTAKKEKAS